ncbi:MAG: hypothetical protein ACR2PR_09480 [Pseudohongiellaceae bacterium]
MAKELQHPQVTDSQIEIWLTNPVTAAFFSCLQWKLEDTRDAAGSGSLTDSSSADLTHALLHRALGQQDAYADAQHAENLLEHYGMVYHIPTEDDDAGSE